ncbi:hypothetical protein TWF788_008263 [Orbilia oligospora]|uniref:Uncharacterized protein n=1 Tax=Orbilia oligospora TaxID=2813651 RepID=A0A7C8UAE0_ORBOL|nr:hypothetical protein TWF788_008263 [Orbilia oligospora]
MPRPDIAEGNRPVSPPGDHFIPLNPILYEEICSDPPDDSIVMKLVGYVPAGPDKKEPMMCYTLTTSVMGPPLRCSTWITSMLGRFPRNPLNSFAVYSHNLCLAAGNVYWSSKASEIIIWVWPRDCDGDREGLSVISTLCRYPIPLPQGPLERPITYSALELYPDPELPPGFDSQGTRQAPSSIAAVSIKSENIPEEQSPTAPELTLGQSSQEFLPSPSPSTTDRTRVEKKFTRSSNRKSESKATLRPLIKPRKIPTRQRKKLPLHTEIDTKPPPTLSTCK